MNIYLVAGAEVDVDGYRPGRPAPVCSNPSSPAYSDPGDNPEFDDYKLTVSIEGHTIDITDKITEELDKKITEIIFQKGEEEC